MVLEIYQGTARLMFNSFGSSLWMMPFSKHCRADDMYQKHFSHRSRSSRQTYQCDEEEFRQNYSGWPTNIINIEIPSIPGKTWSIIYIFHNDNALTMLITFTYFLY